MPQPRKTRRTLHTPEEVALARRNVASSESAAALAKGILAQADKWVGRPDQWLATTLVTPPEVPRAFNISFEGCPVHGREAFKAGNYGFEVDPDRPWKTRCPIGGEEYPSNDFGAFLASGMKDRSLLTGPYADDGWGWEQHLGDKHKWWFVAYYNHWLWLRYTIPLTLNFSRAYLLTGDPKYAEKAIVLLDRIADVYPRMDHNKQSRYAKEFAPSYTGKIVNAIWEAGVATNLAEAYDNVWDAVDASKEAQQYLGRTGPQIRGNIEANLLAEIKAAYDRAQIRGNFGMHQKALLTDAIVAQAGDERAIVDRLLNDSGGKVEHEGIGYALTNYFSRDGVCMFETAPGYAMTWVENLTTIAELLKRLGVNLYRDPRMRAMYTYPERMVAVGKFTPAIGDSGSAVDGAVRLSPEAARIAYREYGGPEFARLVRRSYDEKAPFRDYDDLFTDPALPPEPPRLSASQDPRLQSDNLAGYGLAMLRNGRARDRADLSLFYGTHVGHGQSDMLNVEFLALGRKVLPDLGYPQFAAEDPEPMGWSRNTISHDTVVVNAKHQANADCGDPVAFAASPTVQFADVDAPKAYDREVTMYRRSLAMINDPRGTYVFDVFRVRGGKEHDYSLHGPDGKFTVSGLELPRPRKGTLAGPDVAFGRLYDDPKRDNPDYGGNPSGYRGSGFSFLDNVQEATASAPWSADWELADLPGQHVRITWLPETPQATFVCDGRPPLGRGGPEKLKYVVSRRSGDAPLASTFLALFEPYRGKPIITLARSLPAEGRAAAGAVAAAVTTQVGTDYIASATSYARKTRFADGLSFAGHFGVLSLDGDGRMRRAFLLGDGEISLNGVGVRLAGSAQGSVESVDYNKRRVVIRLDDPEAKIEPDAMAGRWVRFSNARHVTAYRIVAARRQGDRLVLDLGEIDLRTLKLLATKIDLQGGAIEVKNVIPLIREEYHAGMTVANERGQPLLRVKKASGDSLAVEPIPGIRARKSDFGAGKDGRVIVNVYDFGVGDAAEVLAAAHVERRGKTRFAIESSGPVEVLGMGRTD